MVEDWDKIAAELFDELWAVCGSWEDVKKKLHKHIEQREEKAAEKHFEKSTYQKYGLR